MKTTSDFALSSNSLSTVEYALCYIIFMHSVATCYHLIRPQTRIQAHLMYGKHFVVGISLTALMLLVRWQEGYLACEISAAAVS